MNAGPEMSGPSPLAALVGQRRVRYILTESYRAPLLDRVRKLVGPGETLDLTDLFAVCSSGMQRLKFSKMLARKMVCVARELDPDQVLVFDASEGWLISGLVRVIRRVAPTVVLVGVQHGLMEFKSVRRRKVRRLISDVLARIHLPVIGAGFGCSRFDAQLCLFNVDCEYVRTLYPQTFCIEATHTLLGLPKEPKGDTYDVVFVDQVLGQRNGAIVDRALRYLAGAGYKVGFRPHPKDPRQGRFTEEDGVVELLGQSLWDLVSADCGLVVSYFSTVLAEAQLFGVPTLAVRLRYVDPGKYKPFNDVVSEDQFESALHAKFPRRLT
jgi:hypothetical protein